MSTRGSILQGISGALRGHTSGLSHPRGKEAGEFIPHPHGHWLGAASDLTSQALPACAAQEPWRSGGPHTLLHWDWQGVLYLAHLKVQLEETGAPGSVGQRMTGIDLTWKSERILENSLLLPPHSYDVHRL